jgi:alkylated DNA repair dioxygenase AlkB
MISHGLKPDEQLEFMRGDVVCLRGTARAFATRQVQETATLGPRHVRYDPVQAERLAALRSSRRSPIE